MTQIVLDTLNEGPVAPDEVHVGPSRTRKLTGRVTKPAAALRDVPNITTYAGVLLAAVGAILLAIAWGKVAGLTNVALQIPFVISAGFTGLGLVAAGLTVVNIAAKQADARERSRQVSELRDLLVELHRTVDGDAS